MPIPKRDRIPLFQILRRMGGTGHPVYMPLAADLVNVFVEGDVFIRYCF